MRRQGAESDREGGVSDRDGRAPDGAARSSRADPIPRTRHGFEIGLFVFALIYGFGARGLLTAGDPGVALVPLGLAAALAFLSAGIALSGWRKARYPGHAPGVDAGIESGTVSGRDGGDDVSGLIRRSAPIRRPGPARAWTVIGLTILYAAFFQALGYVLATLLYTAAVAERFGARRRTILMLAPSVTLLTFLLFRVVLGARLPAGILG